MATDKPSNASGIFSNITVKQSMSSFAGSPKAGDRNNDQGLTFGQMQRQIQQHEKSDFNKSHYNIYDNEGFMDSKSASRVQKKTFSNEQGGKRNQTASYNVLKNEQNSAMIIDGQTRELLQMTGKISVMTNVRKQKILAAQMKRDAENYKDGPTEDEFETLPLQQQQMQEQANMTRQQQFLNQKRITQYAESQPKTEITDEQRATHGNITVGQMPSNEQFDKDEELDLEVEVESPYLDKAAIEAKLGLNSQNIKHDSYFSQQEALEGSKHLQTDHLPRSMSGKEQADLKKKPLDTTKAVADSDNSYVQNVKQDKQPAKNQSAKLAPTKNSDIGTQKQQPQKQQLNVKSSNQTQNSDLKVEQEAFEQRARTSDMRFHSQKESISSNLGNEEPTSDGIKLVKRLIGMRRYQQDERATRINKNRGLGSTKTAYSTNYHDFHSQSLTNMTHLYSGGDRSHNLRKLQSSEFLVTKLPAIEYHGAGPIKAIEYPADSIQSTLKKSANLNRLNNKDSLFDSTTMEEVGARQRAGSKVRGEAEKEMTTGWQFATQIEDDEYDENRRDVIGDRRDQNVQSALMLANREMIPSMLDPEFEEDAMTPGRRSQQELTQTRSGFNQTTNLQDQKNRMQLMNLTKGGEAVTFKREPVQDYSQSTFWVPQGSLLDQVGRKPRAMGIKEYAWRGVPAEKDSKHFTHHYDRKFLEDQRKRAQTIVSDGLPCGIEEVPKQLYVNSDMRLRRTSDIQRELMREQIFRSEFNMFLNSKEGQNYYAGVLPIKSKKDTNSKGTMSSTRGARTTSKGNSTSCPPISKRHAHQDNQSSGRSNSRENSLVKDMPEDVMVILVKNHKKRDESQRLRKENARRLIKEKQEKAQEEIRRKRQLRMKGIPLPEEMNKQDELRQSSEQFLIAQKQKRLEKQAMPTSAEMQVMQMMNDHEQKNLSEEQLGSLKTTIDGFNEICFKKVASSLAESFEQVFPQPKNRQNQEGQQKKTFGRKAIDVQKVIEEATADIETQEDRLTRLKRRLERQRFIF